MGFRVPSMGPLGATGNGFLGRLASLRLLSRFNGGIAGVMLWTWRKGRKYT